LFGAVAIATSLPGSTVVSALKSAARLDPDIGFDGHR